MHGEHVEAPRGGEPHGVPAAGAVAAGGPSLCGSAVTIGAERVRRAVAEQQERANGGRAAGGVCGAREEHTGRREGAGCASGCGRGRPAR